MTKYIINGKDYNCSKNEAIDIAESNNCDAIYIKNKPNHWRYSANNGGKWFLAYGSYQD